MPSANVIAMQAAENALNVESSATSRSQAVISALKKVYTAQDSDVFASQASPSAANSEMALVLNLNL